MEIKLKKKDWNIILLVLAVLIVAALWEPLWLLMRVAIFAIAVYFVYQILKNKV